MFKVLFTKHPMIGHDLATLAWFMALCYRVVSSFALCCEKVYKQCIASHENSRFSLHFSECRHCWEEMTSKIGLECDDPKVHLKARWFDLNSSHSRRQDRKPFCLFPQRIKNDDGISLNILLKCKDQKWLEIRKISCLTCFYWLLYNQDWKQLWKWDYQDYHLSPNNTVKQIIQIKFTIRNFFSK